MWGEADDEIARLSEDQDGIFTIADARSCDFTDRQIDRRLGTSWVPLYDGVYRMAGAPLTWRGEMRAACAAGTPPIAISHRCAGEIYRVPWRQPDVEITTRRWQRTSYSGLIVHESIRFDDRDIDHEDHGFPVVRAEFMLLQLAALRPNPNYLEAVIHAVRRGRYVTYESTMETFDRHARRGVPGVRALREALQRWRPGDAVTQSDPELDLIRILRKHGFDPVPQYRVYDEHGLFVAQVDAGLPQWRITIEYESDQEHLDEFQIAHDDKRRNAIIAADYKPLSARKHDLRRGALDLIEQIERIVRRAARKPA
jgi:hypothetical protein